MTENELRHHGILGQKWGVRRFQNADGSYTSAGKKRYGIDPETGKKSKEGRRLEKGDREVNYYSTRAKRRFDRAHNQVMRPDDNETTKPVWKVSKDEKDERMYDFGSSLARAAALGVIRMRPESSATNYAKGKKFEKKAYESAEKFGIKVKDIKSVKDMSASSERAGKDFVERTASEKVGMVATDTLVSIGFRAVSLGVGIPVSLAKTHTLGELKYKEREPVYVGPYAEQRRLYKKQREKMPLDIS